MAMGNCRECGKPISTEAATCPNCGVGKPAMRKERNRALWGVIAVVVAVGLIANAGSSDEPDVVEPTVQAVAPAVEAPTDADRIAWRKTADDEKANPAVRLAHAEKLVGQFGATDDGKHAQTLIAGLTEAVEDSKSGAQWSYQSDVDPMSGKTSKNASVISTNAFEFDFPYTGSQHARLMVRRHVRHGNDVILSIEKGQLLCSSYDCGIRVRFDDGAPQTYAGTEPADNSSDTVFLPYSTLAKKIASSKRMRIEANVYDQGALMAEFDVSGFKPDLLK